MEENFKILNREENIKLINRDISHLRAGDVLDTNLISDGYHTFGELYEHRNQLFIALCRAVFYHPKLYPDSAVWKSKKHFDGTEWDGWFILGIGTHKGTQITYHLPISKWDECSFACTYDRAPEFDGHTSADVLERLKNL